MNASPQPHGGTPKSASVHTIRIGDHRTSVRLETVFWQAMETVAVRENLSVHEICTEVSERLETGTLTAAIRNFLLAYAWSGSREQALQSVRDGVLPSSTDRP